MTEGRARAGRKTWIIPASVAVVDAALGLTGNLFAGILPWPTRKDWIVVLAIFIGLVGFAFLLAWQGRSKASSDTPGTVHLFVRQARNVVQVIHPPDVGVLDGRPDRPRMLGEIPEKPVEFQERRELAQRILDQLGSHERVVLVGPPGTGKTQLAGEVARAERRNPRSLVIWIGGDNVVPGLASVANELGVGKPDDDSAKQAARLRDYLQSWPNDALLVLDNARDPDSVRDFLPVGGARVLLTSTDRAFENLGRLIEVGQFDRSESLGYLHGWTGIDDPVRADELAHSLDDLPLALGQAAAVIHVQHLNYRKYLEMFAALPVEQLLPRPPGAHYPRAVDKAILLSIGAAVSAATPLDRPELLLRLVAVLASDGTNWHMLADLSGTGGEAEMTGGLALCERFNLIRRAGNSREIIVMHRLVARVIRDRDKTLGQLSQTVDLALGLLERLLDQSEKTAEGTRSRADTLLGHIDSVWHALSMAEPSTKTTALRRRGVGLRTSCVKRLRTMRDFPRAIAVGRAVVRDSEEVLEQNDPALWAARDQLAYALLQTNEHREGLQLLESSVRDMETYLGKIDRRTLEASKDLAGSYVNSGELKAAVRIAQETLDRCVRALGPDDELTISAKSVLAHAHSRKGNHTAAISLYEEVVADRRRALGPTHEKTLWSENTLTTAYQRANRAEARDPVRSFSEALNVYETSLAPDHPQILLTKENLAAAYKDAGHTTMATQLLRETLPARESMLGPNHPKVSDSRVYLAYLYRSDERWAEAVAVGAPAYRARREVQGIESGDTTWALAVLAHSLIKAGKRREAVFLYEEALAELRRKVGEQHAATIEVRKTLADLRSWMWWRRTVRRHDLDPWQATRE